MGKIISFYKYIDIQYPKQVLKWLQKICQDLGLRGRIILAHEGINGTVGGTDAHIKLFTSLINKHELFTDMSFKYDEGGAEYFPRMQIKVKSEIVHLGLDTQTFSFKKASKHLTPDAVHELMERKPADLLIFDARNDYEWKIGKFENALTPNIENFRDLPQYIDENIEQFKDKQVIMYCTGGVRCERASVYLKSKGVTKEIYQIDGGIIEYAQKYPNGFFKGKNYVFDGRISVRITQDVLGSCALCNQKCDDYVNCFNAVCNKHFICCTNCVKAFNNCCSESCKNIIATKPEQKRPERKTHYNV